MMVRRREPRNGPSQKLLRRSVLGENCTTESWSQIKKPRKFSYRDGLSKMQPRKLVSQRNLLMTTYSSWDLARSLGSTLRRIVRARWACFDHLLKTKRTSLKSRTATKKYLPRVNLKMHEFNHHFCVFNICIHTWRSRLEQMCFNPKDLTSSMSAMICIIKNFQ